MIQIDRANISPKLKSLVDRVHTIFCRRCHIEDCGYHWYSDDCDVFTSYYHRTARLLKVLKGDIDLANRIFDSLFQSGTTPERPDWGKEQVKKMADIKKGHFYEIAKPRGSSLDGINLFLVMKKPFLHQKEHTLEVWRFRKEDEIICYPKEFNCFELGLLKNSHGNWYYENAIFHAKRPPLSKEQYTLLDRLLKEDQYFRLSAEMVMLKMEHPWLTTFFGPQEPNPEQ